MMMALWSLYSAALRPPQPLVHWAQAEHPTKHCSVRACLPDVPLVLSPTEIERAQLPENPAEIDEVWLNAAASDVRSLGERIQHGDVVVCLPGIATEQELRELLGAGMAASEAQ